MIFFSRRGGPLALRVLLGPPINYAGRPQFVKSLHMDKGTKGCLSHDHDKCDLLLCFVLFSWGAILKPFYTCESCKREYGSRDGLTIDYN